MTIANSSLLCKNKTTENIEKKICRSGSKIYLVIMCLTYCLIGVGVDPLYTLAVSYINEKKNRNDGGLYNGIYFAASKFGPALSFALYSFFITLLVVVHYWMCIDFLHIHTHIRKQTVVPHKIKFSRFSQITKTISRNTPYIFICIGMFFDGMMNNAFGVFMAKYIEVQFRIPSGKAALFALASM
ncbi:hypothetical protein HZS_1282, partial [Henneguya salminicola]